VIFLFFIFCGAPQGPAVGGPQTGVDVAYGILTENEIQRFLRVFPTFVEIVEREGKEINLETQPGDIVSAFRGMSILNKEIVQLDSKLRAAGMGWNEFWPAYGKTMFAYTAILLDSLKVEAKKEMVKNEAEIKKMEALLNDPKIPESQKSAIKASLEAMKSATQTFNQFDTIYARVPQSNKELVKKYLKEINEIVNRD